VDERLAWAHEHGVEPPAYVKSLVEQASPAKKSCCSDSKSKVVTTSNSCCSSHGAHDKCAAKHEEQPKGVSILQALRCRGLSANWIGMAPTVTSEQLECSISFQVIEWLEPSHVILSSRDLAPPNPPPRLATV
jgi:hypothetical protein